MPTRKPRKRLPKGVIIDVDAEVVWPFVTLDGQSLETVDDLIAYYRVVEKRLSQLEREQNRLRQQLGTAAQKATGGPPLPWQLSSTEGTLLVDWPLSQLPVRAARDVEFHFLEELLGDRFADLFNIDARARNTALQGFLQEEHEPTSNLGQAQAIIRHFELFRVVARPRTRVLAPGRPVYTPDDDEEDAS